MSRRLVYTISEVVTDNICKEQLVTNQLTLNGDLADKVKNCVVFPNYSRNLRIKSLNSSDLSNITFIITGQQNGVLVTENVTGPGVDKSVETIQLYDKVDSIAANPEDLKVYASIGVGQKVSLLVKIDTTVTVLGAAMSVINSIGGSTTKLYSTFDDVKNNGYTHKQMYDQGNHFDFLEEEPTRVGNGFRYEILSLVNQLILVIESSESKTITTVIFMQN